jgi:hypothetical protein
MRLSYRQLPYSKIVDALEDFNDRQCFNQPWSSSSALSSSMWTSFLRQLLAAKAEYHKLSIPSDDALGALYTLHHMLIVPYCQGPCQ